MSVGVKKEEEGNLCDVDDVVMAPLTWLLFLDRARNTLPQRSEGWRERDRKRDCRRRDLVISRQYAQREEMIPVTGQEKKQLPALSGRNAAVVFFLFGRLSAAPTVSRNSDDDENEREGGLYECRDEEVLEDGGGRLQHFADSSSK